MQTIKPLDVAGLLISGLMLLAVGCASPPPPRIPHAEVVRRELVVGDTLGRKLDKTLTFSKDQELQVYLKGIAQRLSSVDPKLSSATLKVFVVEDKDGIWRDFGLPGNRVYLSAGLLKQAEFETEIAAMLAVELAHLARGDVIARMRELLGLDKPVPGNAKQANEPLPAQPGELLKDLDFFGPDGIFAFSEKTRLDNAAKAVSLLYAAGFDSRGLLAMWQKFIDFPDHSPLEIDTLDKLVEATRKAVSSHPPLRNPVVRSSEFVKMKKRIQAL